MQEQLTSNFLIGLFKLAIHKKGVCQILVDEMKYSFIPKELKEYKLVLKYIVEHFKIKQTLPSIGGISQKYSNDQKVQDLLIKIRDSNLPDVKEIIGELEIYIKKVRFQLMYDDVADLFNAGKSDEAIELTMKESESITNFSLLRGKGRFVKVFRDFRSNIDKRSAETLGSSNKKISIPFGIDVIDDLTKGLDVNETALWIMRSGVGKSTALKHNGMTAARLGYKVLHIQLEGTEEEAVSKYDQVWTAVSYRNVRAGDIDEVVLKKLYKISDAMIASGKDISIYASGEFDELTMKEIRELIIEFFKEEGAYPDLLIVDSIDLAHPGDGNRYGVDTQSIKMKIQNSAKKLKNIVSEFDGMRAITATQTGDIPYASWNDPDFFITRSNSMGDKNIANSFSYVFTGNQTQDEYKEKVMRIYIDKLRHQEISIRSFYIATAFAQGRFYNRLGTLRRFIE